MDRIERIAAVYRDEWKNLVTILARELGRAYLEDIEDAVSDSFLSLLTGSAMPENPVRYLLAAARRRYFEIRRKLRPLISYRAPRRPLSDELQRFVHEELSPRLREVIALRMSGLRHPEIAAKMGIALGAVKVFVARATARLRRAQFRFAA